MTTEELSLSQPLSEFSQKKTIDMHDDPHAVSGNKCFWEPDLISFFAIVEESEHVIHQFWSF